MAYRQPAFMVGHPAAAVTDFTLDYAVINGTMATEDRRRSIDYRQGLLALLVANGTSPAASVDFGASYSGTVNRFVIPAGHDFSGEDIDIYDAGDWSFTTATLLASGTPSDSGVFDLSVTSSTRRYWRFLLDGTYSSQDFYFGELWWGEYVQLSASAAVNPRFDSGLQYSVFEETIGGGEFSVEFAPPRRRFSLSVANLDPSGADYSILDDVLQTGGSEPFWYWPPDDTDPGPYLVRLTDRQRRRQDFAAPSVSVAYTVSLEMIETLA